MKSYLIHNYGELKIIDILKTWRELKNDRDCCWTLDSQIEELKQIFKEFMDEDHKEKTLQTTSTNEEKK